MSTDYTVPSLYSCSRHVGTLISRPIFMPALALGEGLIAALMILNIPDRMTQPARACRNECYCWTGRLVSIVTIPYLPSRSAS